MDGDFWDALPPPLPSEDVSALDQLLLEQDLVLWKRQARWHLSESKLRHLVATGRWRTPAKGVLVAHNGPLARRQQLWVAVLSANSGAVLAGLTAAQAGGLRRSPLEPLHVLVPGDRKRGTLRFATVPMPDVWLHRTTCLPDKDLLRDERPPRTKMARSLVDAAQWSASDDEARAIVAAGCQQRLVSPTSIREVVGRLPRARRRAVVLETVDFAEAGAVALSEIEFTKLCRRYGLPEPDRQAMRVDRGGRQRFLDVYWPQFRLHVEIDGAWHTDAVQWWADMRRQNDLWIAGDRVLRFPAWLVRHKPAEVAAQLREALLASGWRP